MFSLLGPLHYPWVLSVVFKCFANIRITDQIAFLCVHAPRGHIYLRFLCRSGFRRWAWPRPSFLMSWKPFAGLRYLLRVTFYSVGRFQTGFHGGYYSPFHFHSVCRFELFLSVRRFQLLWHVSPSRWFFSACVAFQLAISGVSRFH